MSATLFLVRARDLVDSMQANGAAFTFKPARASLPASFEYALPRGGDHWKCRGIIASAKADPTLWTALVAEIGRRAGGAE